MTVSQEYIETSDKRFISDYSSERIKDFYKCITMLFEYADCILCREIRYLIHLQKREEEYPIVAISSRFTLTRSVSIC